MSRRKRVEFLRTKYVPVIKKSPYFKQEIGVKFDNLTITDAESLFQAFVYADPSDNKKYLFWMIERFLKEPEKKVVLSNGVEREIQPKRLIVEDLNKTSGFLDFFNKFSVHFKEEQRDINIYSCVDDFFDVVEAKMPSEGDFLSASQMERQYKTEIDVWLDNENWKVVIPKTLEASSAYGSNTRWCTAGSNGKQQFDYHTQKGPLIILINKKADKNDKKTHKFQFHFETNQFMDAHDVTVSNDYLEFLSADKELLDAFLKNLKDRYSFLIRLKLNLDIPEDCKVIKANDDKERFVLNLQDMKAETLPHGLVIEGSLDISNNKNIKIIENITVQDDLILDKSSIVTIGENVVVGGNLQAMHCEKLKNIEPGLIIKDGGDLKVDYCDNLSKLPDNSNIGGSVYVTNCPKISDLPKNTIVKWGAYVRGTKLQKRLLNGEINLVNIDNCYNTKIGLSGNEIYYTEIQ